MLQVGSVLDNKYKILSEIGHGGMSVVYLAINERAGKTWAVKEVRKDGTMDFEQVKAGLVVETDMLKQLHHDHLPSIIDVIDLEDSFIIIMDYVEGQSAKQIMEGSGAQPYDTVVDWGKQICEVLGYLHSQNPPIIYRDMKPSNLMIKPPTSDYPNGKLMLIDFGTARTFKNRDMVEDTVCLGTRGYAAPEQFGGRGETDPRTDIYCTGATLYHMVTGHSPAEPPYEIKPLGYWDPTLAESGLEYIINKCCQQDPSARYQSCGELLYDLENIDDIGNRGKIKIKWNLFLTCLAMFIVGVGMMIGFKAAESGAKTDSYDSYLDQANDLGMEASALDAKKKLYLEALKIDPSRSRAYEDIMDYVLDDGSLSGDEIALIKSTLNERNGGNVKNIEYLRSANAEDYNNVIFDLGLGYFFMTDGSDENMRIAADDYFVDLYENEDFAGKIQKQQLAKDCYMIGHYIKQLGNAGLRDNPDYSYGDFWDDLYEIADGDVTSKVGNPSQALALYNRVAFLVSKYYKEFISAKAIKQSDMEAFLSSIESGIGSIETNNDRMEALKEDAHATLEQARVGVNSYYTSKQGGGN